MTDAIKLFLTYVEAIFVIYLIGYSTFLFLSVVVGSSTMYHYRRKEKLKNALTDDYYIPISIVVPAYNEEVTVVDTVKSLLSLEYKLYEILVVDDGSRDKTSEELINYFHMHPLQRPIRRQLKCQPEEFIYYTETQKVPITLIRKKNGGKADALNMGINASQYPYFICMDADSVLQYDSLQKIVRPVLENDNVVAVGGVVRPSNGVELEQGHIVRYRLPKNILACMQALEYDRSFLASRILFDKFNGSLIISGAFGLFKKDVVIAAGGYDSSTMGEDMELVVKLHVFCRTHNYPYLIKYATDAICWSQAPERLRDLKKQRRRWHLGLFQCMWKHHSIFANPKFGATSFISYFYFLLYELLSPYFEVFGLLTTLLAFVVDLINVPFMILFFGIYAVFGSVMSLTSFFARIYTLDLKLSFRDMMKAMVLCLFEITCLRFILAFVRMTAFIGYKKKKLNWGRIERKKMGIRCVLTLLLASAVGLLNPTAARAAGDLVYVAGNPDLYPVEYYDEESETYRGVLPEFLEELSEQTGITFVYIRPSEQDNRLYLAKNLQVEMVSGWIKTVDTAEGILEADNLTETSRPVLTLEMDGMTYEIGFAFTEIAGKELIAEVNQAVLEFSAEEANGLLIQYAVKEQGVRYPVVLIVCLSAGCVVLAGAIIWLLWYLRRRERNRRLTEAIDEVTGIGNMEYFSLYYSQMIADHNREAYAVVYIGINTDKIYEYYNTEEVKCVLCYAANVLKTHTADADIAARVSENGFAVARRTGSEQAIKDWMEEIFTAFSCYQKEEQKNYRPEINAGIYFLSREDKEPDQAIFNAKQGFVRACEGARNYSFTTREMVLYAKESCKIQATESTFQNREFLLYLQFIVDAQTEKICGAEALTRWKHPMLGLLTPGRFLDLLDEEQQAELDYYVFEQVCRLQEERSQRGEVLFSISCNFARMTFTQPQFWFRMQAIAERYQFPRQKLIIEITENMIYRNGELLLQNVERLRGLGFRIALDDMGSGYTSFRDLKLYPIDILKVDKCVLDDADTHKGEAILESLIDLGHNLEMSVLCEGIEKKQQADMLRRIGCDQFQGYHYYQPMPYEEALLLFQDIGNTDDTVREGSEQQSWK